jgi:Single-strand binding protein family
MKGEDASEGTLAKSYVLQVLKKDQADPVHHEFYGEGYSVTLGEGDSEAAVEVYPEARAVRLLSGYSGVDLFDIVGVTRRQERLRFETDYETEKVAGEVSPDGSFQYIRTPRRANSESFEEAPADVTAQSSRVTLRGRIGSDPRFRKTTKAGQLVASFPLGVHPDAETTEWHSIVAFGERAKRLQDKPLAKGQLVEVVGYVHEHEGRTRTGETKSRRQIYATAIRTTLPTRPSGS